MSIRRVAITGIGMSSEFGAGVDRAWGAVTVGESCLNSSPLEINDDSSTLNQADHPKISRIQTLGMQATQEAIHSANFSRIPKDAIFILGTNVGNVSMAEDIRHEDVPSYLTADSIYRWADHHSLAEDIATQLGGCEKHLAITGACASGAMALGYAHDMILLEQTQIAIVGGVDTTTSFKSSGHALLRTVSHTGKVRPFDVSRDGTVFTEGSAFLVLENLDHCLARGHRPLGILSGYGATTDTNSLTAPDPTGMGAKNAMRTALENAGILPQSVDHIQAHATATRLNDLIEAAAIEEVFGCHLTELTVSADKGAIGHTFGASGVISVVLAVMMIQTGRIPPATGCDSIDPDIRLPIITSGTIERKVSRVLCNNFGFGGSNVSIIVEKI